MNMRIAEAVEMIKAEFQEKYGVEASLSISIHTMQDKEIDKSEADQIAREVADEPRHDSGRGICWVSNRHELGRPFDVVVFYEEIPFTPEPEQLEAEVR